MDELKLFNELNLIKSKIDSDLNVLRNIEYDSKLKSTNLYNKQLYDKLQEKEKLIEEGKNQQINDHKNLDSNLKNLTEEIEVKINLIDNLQKKIKTQENIIIQGENNLRDKEGKILLKLKIILYINIEKLSVFENIKIKFEKMTILEAKNKDYLKKIFESNQQKSVK